MSLKEPSPSALVAAQAWTSLVLLCARSGSETQCEMLALIEKVMLLEEEHQTTLTIDLMKADGELRALRAHSERLFGFLLTALQTCDASSSSTARLHAATIREYLEAWDQRTRPSEEALRQEFEALSRKCRPSVALS